MAWAKAQEQLDKIYNEIDRSVVNKNYHQGIITINKSDFDNYLFNLTAKSPDFNVQLNLFQTADPLQDWWDVLGNGLKGGPRKSSRTTFETDMIGYGTNTYKIQYAALNPESAKATQDNVANWVKRTCRNAAKKTNTKIGGKLLNAHGAEGKGEPNFPTDPQDIDPVALVQEGYNRPHTPEMTAKADKAVKRGASGAQGTVANQRIDLFIKQWEAWLDSEQAIGVYKIQHWFVANWYKKFFGKQISFEGNWSDRKVDAGLLVQHTIMPNKLNSGIIDAAIYRAVQKELQNGRKVVAGFLKVIRYLGIGKMLDLFANSPSPLDKTTAIIKKEIIDSLFSHKTKADMRLKVNKKLYADAKKAKGKSTRKNKEGLGKLAQTVQAGKTIRAKGGRSKRSIQQAKTSQSPIALRNLLNEALPQAVAQNMTSPALQYRTGRFANSTRIENLVVGPRGGIHIDYTYMRAPYETFEPGGKQGSVQRDPRKLIGKSIREISVGILGKQPTTLRRT